MKSVAGTNMARQLRQTQLYRFNGESLVEAELAAYDAGFQWVEQALSQLEDALFPHTATEVGLEQWEQLAGFLPSQTVADQRRAHLQGHFSLEPTDDTASTLAHSFAAAGFQGRWSQEGLQLRVEIQELVDSALSVEEVQHYLEKYMPVHMGWQLVYGTLTFNMIDEKDYSWEQWDQLGASWQEMDHYQHQKGDGHGQ